VVPVIVRVDMSCDVLCRYRKLWAQVTQVGKGGTLNDSLGAPLSGMDGCTVMA
jgi:hypothetical protein